MKVKALHIILYFILCCVACRENYQLPESHRNINSLVVEGHLNNGGTQTIIRLSRAFNIEDSALVKPETGAEVTLSDGSSLSLLFTENKPGEYIINNLALDRAAYRLHITTRDRKQYISDTIAVKNAPEIDSLSWHKEEDGVKIAVSTHDPQNNSRYYRWQYEETWALVSWYPSLFEYKNGQVIPRADPDAILYCWGSEKSTRIITASSTKLSDDVISTVPVAEVPPASIKLAVRYSILVKQFALTADAYSYWDILKTNTEQVGTLFDPQPSQLKSNIRCITNPSEQVIGYVSAGKITEKRLFITRGEVEPWSYNPGCFEIIVPLDSVAYFFGPNKLHIPTIEWRVMDRLSGYYASTVPCVDCTSMGSNVKPDFW
jgi:hypothetical protein